MKAKRLLFGLTLFLLSAFIIAYIVIQLISGLTTDVQYQYASSVVSDQAFEKTGYLVRNETILYAEREGVLTYSARESQKLGTNQLVAKVFDNSQGVTVQNQIRKIEEKISILERSTVDTSYLTSDVSKIDAKLYDSILKTKLSMLDGKIDLAQVYKKDLMINFNKRQLITSSSQNFDEQIQALKDEKSKLTASLHEPLSTVYSPVAGYFSTLLDGYETTYTPSAINGLTVDSFHQLIQQPQIDYGARAIGKIITDFHWYTLCEVSASEAEHFTEGKTYRISYLYSAGQQIQALLQKKVTQTDNENTVLVFLIEEIPSDFDYTRMQTIRIVTDSKEGISFPRSALRMVDGVQGVYVISGNAVGFKKVDIIHNSDSHYLSKTQEAIENEKQAAAKKAQEEGVVSPMENINPKEYLSQFDRVITEGKDLYVGKILD